MSIGQQLIELLGEDGERWCQRAHARDIHGQRIHPLDPDAVSWCVAGACIKLGIHRESLRAVFPFSVGAFNDTNSWRRVKAKIMELDNAIR